MHNNALHSTTNTMKIQASSTSNIFHITDGTVTGTSAVSTSDSVAILGMNRAYNNLKRRIKKEGLYSLAFSGQPESRFDQGLSTLSRI
jgi:hypothetical protein